MQDKLFFDPTIVSHKWIDFKDEYWNKCYPDAEEYIDKKTPEAKFEYLVITGFKDAIHDTWLDNRRSVTGILIFLGSVSIFYYSKRQNNVES